MWKKPFVKFLVISFACNMLSSIVFAIAEHPFRVAAQKSPWLYEIMLDMDLFNFCVNGGGAYGYSNYYKYQAAVWRADPERTLVQRIMVWDRGFWYDASNPPEEYAYLPKFER